MRSKPVVTERKYHRHQPEQRSADRDDGEAIDVERRHWRLHPEVAMRARLLHATHCSSGVAAGCGRGQTRNPVVSLG
jgi:hypothetical protein